MGSYSFDIPYSRQQLADYLGVERSALSNELSKMQKDGIIRYEKIILRSWPPVRCARTQLISGIIEKYCRVSVPRQGRLSDPDASCCPDSKFLWVDVTHRDSFFASRGRPPYFRAEKP